MTRKKARWRSRSTAVAMFAFACSGSSSPPPPPAAVPAQVAYAGCSSVYRGPRCRVSLTASGRLARPFVLWVRDDGRQYRLGIGETSAIVEGGIQFQVDAMDLPTTLTLRDTSDRAVWSLPVQLDESSPSLDAFEHGLAHDKPTSQEIHRRAQQASAALGDSERARAQLRGAQYLYAAGDLEGSLAWFERAYESGMKLGDLTSACSAAMAAGFQVVERQFDHEQATRWFPRQQECAAAVPEFAAAAHYGRGVFDMRSGHRLEALHQYHQAWVESLRLGLSGQAPAYGSALAATLSETGFHEASRKMADVVASIATSECDKLTFDLNRGWQQMLDEEGGRGTPGGAHQTLTSAIAAFEEASCASTAPTVAETAHLNLAQVCLNTGQTECAKDHLQRARLDPAPIAHQLAVRRVEAEIALNEGQLDLAQQRLAAAQAIVSDDPEHTWRNETLAGRIAEANRLPNVAAQHYRKAEAALDDGAWAFVLGLNAGTYLAGRTQSASRLIELELNWGRPKAAICVARTSRRRAVLAGLRSAQMLHREPSQAVRGKLAQYQRARAAMADADEHSVAALGRRANELDQLRRSIELDLSQSRSQSLPAQQASQGCETPLAHHESELVLLFHKGTSGWWLFAHLAGDLRVIRTPEPTRANQTILGPMLLPHLSGFLDQATRLRVLSTGDWLDVDIQAWTHRGMTLGRRFPIVHGLDAPRSTTEPTRTLVPILFSNPDPLRDIGSHRPRILGFASALQSTDAGRTEVIDNPTRAQFIDKLGQASMLTFFGHAQKSLVPVSDDRAWSSTWLTSPAMLLSGHDTLDALDVLTAPASAPRSVLLLGCGTGRVDPSSLSGGMTLPHALIVRGAAQVLATTDNVAPQTALALMDALPKGGLFNLADAVFEAKRTLANQEDGPPLEALGKFRVWEP